ncbi:MAG: hypothetical protein ACJAQT_002081 [Akkermansiaceae bacterium]|jgi:hypothetical protein
MKFIKIILAVVTPYFLAATDVWGESPRIRTSVFHSSPDDPLSSVQEIPTTDLPVGTVVEYYGRNQVGDGGAGLATWDGTAWVKSFKDNANIVSKLERGLQEIDEPESVEFSFTSTDFPYEILHSPNIDLWTPVTPIALNSSGEMTTATLQIPTGFVRIGVDVPSPNLSDGYSPDVSRQALLAGHWDQEISAAPLSPVSLFTSAGYSSQVADGCGPFSKASHLYTMDETSGSFVDLIGDADITESGLIPQVVVANEHFQSARFFNGTDSYGIGTAISQRAGRPFWFSVGLNFDSISGTAGILSESAVSAISSGEWGWAFWRIGSKVELRVRRHNVTSNADSVSIEGISAGKNCRSIVAGKGCGAGGGFLDIRSQWDRRADLDSDCRPLPHLPEQQHGCAGCGPLVRQQ